MAVKTEEFKLTRPDGSVDVVEGRSVSPYFYVRKAVNDTWGKFWALCHKPTGAIVAKPKLLTGARLVAKEFEAWVPASTLATETPSVFKTAMETRPTFVSYLKVYAYGKPCLFNEFLAMHKAEMA